MPIRLQDKGRDFKRLRHTPEEKAQLRRAGFQHVLSSNVSAIAQDGEDLIIRFHGGATYRYPKNGNLFDAMLKSNSKGRFVWQKLIRTKAPFRKVGSVRLKGDEEFTDRDLMVAAEPKEKKPLIPLVGKTVLEELGIIATSNVVNDILVTNAIS